MLQNLFGLAWLCIVIALNPVGNTSSSQNLSCSPEAERNIQIPYFMHMDSDRLQQMLALFLVLLCASQIQSKYHENIIFEIFLKTHLLYK